MVQSEMTDEEQQTHSEMADALNFTAERADGHGKLIQGVLKSPIQLMQNKRTNRVDARGEFGAD